MPLPYKPEDLDEEGEGKDYGPPPTGEFDFVVGTAEQRTSEAGNVYINLKLGVETGDFTATVYAALMFSGRGLFRTKTFMDAVGVDFNTAHENMDPEDFVGLSGRAKFVHSEKKGKNGHPYLNVGMWIVAEKSDFAKEAEKVILGADDGSTPF